MPRLEMCLILLAVPVGLVAAGYGWASRLEGSASLRIAAAMLLGLASLTFSVSVVNAILPLAGIWAWVCYLPWLYPFSRRSVRGRLALDLRSLATAQTVLVALSAAGFLAALLWPLLSRPELVFYDGSSNHDAFLWIVNAGHLQRSSYLVGPVPDPAHPLFYPAAVITGVAPVWGRMGGEGLLALVSSLVRVPPLNLYVVATAALFVPWLAAVFLVVRTFFSTARFGISAVAVVLLQPVFVFFHANANLPNLVAALDAALFLVALARATSDASDWTRWGLTVPLAGHALLCSYPEAVPVVAVSAACLLAHAFWRANGASGRSRAWWVFAAALGSAAINPLTSLRAAHGFITSLRVLADPAAQRPNIFHDIGGFARVPAVVTLSVPLGHDIAWPLLGVACTVVLGFVAWLGWRNARDRVGALAILAGIPVMVAVTLVMRADYGWQKMVQFSAIPLAALIPASGLLTLDRLRCASDRLVRTGARVGAVALIVLLGYATVANFRETHKWSRRKCITAEWFAARHYSERNLRNATVEVDSRHFDYPFFYTMWSAYFLTGSRVHFVGDRTTGGYLRAHLDPHEDEWFAPARAAFVGLPTLAGTAGKTLWAGGTIGFVAPPAAQSVKK